MFACFKPPIRSVVRYLSVGVLLIVILLTSVVTVVAQTDTVPTLYFETPTGSITQGDLFAVKIFTDSLKPINALSVNIYYPQELLELHSINTLNSFINLWRGISPVSDNGTVYFEGGTTTPFSGSGGKIGEIVFKAKKQGLAYIASTKADFYYADGTGTRIFAENVQANILISSDGTAVLPPLSFQVASSPVIDAQIVDNPIGGYPLAAFTVSDKGTGIQSSQIRFLKYFFWSYWENISNPVPIPSAALAFQVKVTDGNGNAVIETVYVWKTLIIACFFAVIIIAIGAVGFRTYRLWRRKKMVL
ncbi:MAG: hypothetical protein UV58_C0024G0017 [Candidatus Wolfebacteria bacterium GW2011_GWC1_43_10]|uniref:Cohesin domain-containing protein n=1 Tax=Candidatus Wolfebacteria bacterium GW2011_GWC1_43_10 TaxID=1619011 RepID=A0A0G1F346_9BACT|nr:MAG: hypothetical protein UV58_C0024G0017 [Candidatus Wolfebacteria bacterium GW2011_GWC1_43_10]KKT22888.1 MAG: hypothetical protein UW08_C0002G0017 [Parcubacteria group bacterium GW2011_GWB1_43_8b]